MFCYLTTLLLLLFSNIYFLFLVSWFNFCDKQAYIIYSVIGRWISSSSPFQTFPNYRSTCILLPKISSFMSTQIIIVFLIVFSYLFQFKELSIGLHLQCLGELSSSSPILFYDQRWISLRLRLAHVLYFQCYMCFQLSRHSDSLLLRCSISPQFQQEQMNGCEMLRFDSIVHNHHNTPAFKLPVVKVLVEGSYPFIPR